MGEPIVVIAGSDLFIDKIFSFSIIKLASSYAIVKYVGDKNNDKLNVDYEGLTELDSTKFADYLIEVISHIKKKNLVQIKTQQGKFAAFIDSITYKNYRIDYNYAEGTFWAEIFTDSQGPGIENLEKFFVDEDVITLTFKALDFIDGLDNRI